MSLRAYFQPFTPEELVDAAVGVSKRNARIRQLEAKADGVQAQIVERKLDAKLAKARDRREALSGELAPASVVKLARLKDDESTSPRRTSRPSSRRSWRSTKSAIATRSATDRERDLDAAPRTPNASASSGASATTTVARSIASRGSSSSARPSARRSAASSRRPDSRPRSRGGRPCSPTETRPPRPSSRHRPARPFGRSSRLRRELTRRGGRGRARRPADAPGGTARLARHASQVAEALAPGPRQPPRRSAEGLAKQ